ncbi:MAG: hypothetical protein KDA79_17820 [Planctomycetaceae bacterium]|nr:hypothetical protein [Planctomycetaceae bacterium]
MTLMTAVTSRQVVSRHLSGHQWNRASAFLCLLLVFAVAGCGGKSDEGQPGDAESSAGSGSDSGSTDSETSRCNDLVGSAVDMLQPDRLGITASSDTAVDLLNSWYRSCGGNLVDLSEYMQVAEPAITQAAGRAGLEAVQSDRFSERDVRHVRDSLLMKQAAESVIEGAESNVERIVRLFDYTCRTIALEPQDRSEVPLTPYHVLLVGRGTSRDRAWVFSALLRQLKMDSVILASSTAEAADATDAASTDQNAAAENGPWLVGVLHEGQVLVFSPKLGLAVPAKDGLSEAGAVAVPATWSQLRQTPELVQQLFSDEKDKAAVADLLQQPRVLAVGSTSLWSPRMGALQTTLSGDASLVVFDGLVDSALGDGLLNRLAGAGTGLGESSAVSVWGWPEQQQQAFDHITEDDRLYQRFLIREYPFRAPTRVRADQERKQLAFDPTYTQLKTRIRQLQGDHAAAIRTYLTVRLSERFNPQLPVPAEFVAMHAQAAEDAYFWMAVCQLEQHLPATAIENLRLYLKKYSTGRWREHSRILLATALAEEGQTADAVRQVELISEEHPQLPGLLFLAKQWQQAGADDSSPPMKATPTPPATPPKEPAPAQPKPEKPASRPESEAPAAAPAREPVVAPRPEMKATPAAEEATSQENPAPAPAEGASSP